MINNILNDLEITEEANNLTTWALIALEDHNYEEAINFASDALQISKNIEQRLALQMIKFAAVHMHDQITDEILEETYFTVGGR